MKKTVLIASLLIIVGALILVIALANSGFDFKGFDMVNTVTYNFKEDIKNISIDVDTTDINILPSENGELTVVSKETEKERAICKVEGDTLKISIEDDKKWYDHISFYSADTEITVYIPKELACSLDIDLSTGDTRIESLSLKSINIECSTGDVSIKNVNVDKLFVKNSTGDKELNNVNCNSLNLESSTGDVELTRVISKGAFNVTTDTGSVELDRCDGNEIKIETDTGDVDGTLLSEKIFQAKTDTGDVRVPSSKTGGMCYITTDTGDIKISISK